MKGNPQVIELLNEVLTAELTAINQYFIHAKMCADWGYTKLAAKVRAESIDEMRHADTLIERILFLDGVPNVQRYSKVNVGETVKEQLELDLQLEHDAIARLNKAIATCRDVGDNASRELLNGILVSEEEHTDWLETQLELIRQIGEQLYCAQQVG
ncbi:MAG: bacterioferritin [Myxococcales bacterium]|nr:bacterioferritin [Myxococcales bacterium]